MSNYMWMPATKKASRPKVSAETKALLKGQADKWVVECLKPKHILPPPEDHDFNYLVDIFTKWHGSFFYFCGTYHCPGPRAISPSFEQKFARMNYTGNYKYTLAYMRHTGQWVEIFYDLDAPACFDMIANEPYFLP